MNRRLFRGIILMFILGLVLALGTKLARAESSAGAQSASARINIRITVEPTMRIIEQTATPEGLQVRLWTNMPQVTISGQTFYFGKPGFQEILLRGTTVQQDKGVVFVNL